MLKNQNSLVFVYGTLRRGHHNHDFIKNATFKGNFSTGPGYKKIIRGLPYLIEDPEGVGTDGEVYEVTPLTLERLDRLEGHPDWYERKIIKLLDGPEAWCYVMSKERI